MVLSGILIFPLLSSISFLPPPQKVTSHGHIAYRHLRRLVKPIYRIFDDPPMGSHFGIQRSKFCKALHRGGRRRRRMTEEETQRIRGEKERDF